MNWWLVKMNKTDARSCGSSWATFSIALLSTVSDLFQNVNKRFLKLKVMNLTVGSISLT